LAWLGLAEIHSINAFVKKKIYQELVSSSTKKRYPAATSRKTRQLDTPRRANQSCYTTDSQLRHYKE